MSHILDDSTLIKRALSGDQKAYETLVLRYQEMVARVVHKITRRPEWVEDLAQEIFLKAFQNLPRFQGRAGFLTWLYRIAVNTSLEALRREKATGRLYERVAQESGSFPDTLIVHDRETGERMVLDRELQLEVRNALSRLNPEMRAVLTLRYLEELSTPEIAEVMDIPEGTVRSRLYYARLELARVLGVPVIATAPARSQKRE